MSWDLKLHSNALGLSSDDVDKCPQQVAYLFPRHMDNQLGLSGMDHRRLFFLVLWRIPQCEILAMT